MKWILLSMIFLVGCGEDGDQSTSSSVFVTINADSSSRFSLAATAGTTLDPNAISSPLGLSVPTTLSEIDCLGIFVGWDDPGVPSPGVCTPIDSAKAPLEIRRAQGSIAVSSGAVLEMGIPSGPSRRIGVVGFRSTLGAPGSASQCPPVTAVTPEMYPNLSPFVLLGNTLVDLEPGDQEVIIDIGSGAEKIALATCSGPLFTGALPESELNTTGGTGGTTTAAFDPASYGNLHAWFDTTRPELFFIDNVCTAPVSNSGGTVECIKNAPETGIPMDFVAPSGGNAGEVVLNVQNGLPGLDGYTSTPTFANFESPDSNAGGNYLGDGNGGDATIFAVVKTDVTAPVDESIFKKTVSTTFLDFKFGASGQLFLNYFDGSNSGSRTGSYTFAASEATVIAATVRANSIELFRNGIKDTSAPAQTGIATPTMPGGAGTISFLNANTDSFLFEILVYDVGLTDQQITEISTGLMGRWGITP